jgi:hypothetical protein
MHIRQGVPGGYTACVAAVKRFGDFGGGPVGIGAPGIVTDDFGGSTFIHAPPPFIGLRKSGTGREYGRKNNENMSSHSSAPVSGFAALRDDVAPKMKKAAAMFP